MENSDSMEKSISMNDPLVSICVPCYNGERFLRRTIESVLTQSYNNFELIIVDDCSTDNSYEIAHSYNDLRIKLSRNELNLGFNSNWNKALSLCSGDYIKLLPQDDIIYKNCIEKQVFLLEKFREENVVFTCCARDIIDENDNVILRRRQKIRGVYQGINAIRMTVRAGTNIFGEPGAVLFRREIIEKIGNFHNTFVFLIDVDYWVRMLCHGNVYFDKSILSKFRIHNQSTSVVIRRKQRDEFKVFINEITNKHGIHISKIDIFRGLILSVTLSILRNIFYKLKLK